MPLEDCKMRCGSGRCGPEERVVVRKEREEDSEEEGGCYVTNDSPLGLDILNRGRAKRVEGAYGKGS